MHYIQKPGERVTSTGEAFYGCLACGDQSSNSQTHRYAVIVVGVTVVSGRRL